MPRRLGLGGFVVALAVVVATGPAQAHASHHHCHRQRVVMRPEAATPPGYAYGRRFDPTPTCRYPDATPYDPDIIGGPNHVGDGGPAANLGGSDPCGY